MVLLSGTCQQYKMINLQLFLPEGLLLLVDSTKWFKNGEVRFSVFKIVISK